MTSTTPPGFVPPPYPYSRLARLAEVAGRHEGGVVDLSVGTPCDPPPRAVVEALANSGSERGYPSSVGAVALREAAASWIERRFGVAISPAQIAACVGTKEFVATSAWYMRLRHPERDVVIAPEIAYPTYAMGAQLAGCKLVTVGQDDAGTRLEELDPEVSGRALMLWLNNPSNPTGALSDLKAAASWGRGHGVPLFSDECYAEFTWEPARPSTVLTDGPGGTEGVVAVHSLSKRSNMAGLRAGFYAGDAELVAYLSAVRQHCGLMVPGPVQGAAVAALEDDEHVGVQRERYLGRLHLLAGALERVGLEVAMPEGGFYLWIAAPDWALESTDTELPSSGWVLAEALATAGGALVSPGELYGEEGSDFVRVAVVQPDDRIELVAKRLEAHGDLELASQAERRERSMYRRN